jgi:prolyl oligopeptidase
LEENSPETENWIRKQNKSTVRFLERIRERLTELYKYPREYAPIKYKSRIFQFRNDGLQNHNVLYTCDTEIVTAAV